MPFDPVSLYSVPLDGPSRGDAELAEFVPVVVERRRLVRAGLVGAGAMAVGGLGAALVRVAERPASADQAVDVEILQTAASIENLGVATYGAILTLPFIGGSTANALLKAFVTTTKDQHAAHAVALNAAVTQLGGKAQTDPDPLLLDIVNQSKPTLSGPGPVVDLALKLEGAAAGTYVHSVSALSDVSARRLAASIMGVAAQHVSILMVVKALLDANTPTLIALPPDLSTLPATVGSTGFPDSLAKTDQARPAGEGAVR